MKNRKVLLLLKLTSGFFLNLSAGYFFAIYAAPGLLDKLNALIACSACFGAAYYIEQQRE